MKRLFLPLALFIPLAAACGDDEMTGLCVSDADCTDLNPTCDFRTGQCVIGCDMANDCGGAFPTCNASGANTMAPAVCICESGSCPAGQACQPDGQCGMATTCGTAGTQGSCAMGETCLPDGTCAATCSNGDAAAGCFSMEMLCDTSTMSATFNTCVDPQSVTGGCMNAASHARVNDGPIISAVELEGQMGVTSPNCTGNATVQRFAANVFSPDGIQSGLFTMGLRRLNRDGMDGNTFSDGPMSATHPTAMEVPGTDEYLVEFTLCLSAAEMMQQLAIYVNDSDGEASNAACFLAR